MDNRNGILPQPEPDTELGGLTEVAGVHTFPLRHQGKNAFVSGSSLKMLTSEVKESLGVKKDFMLTLHTSQGAYELRNELAFENTMAFSDTFKNPRLQIGPTDICYTVKKDIT